MNFYSLQESVITKQNQKPSIIPYTKKIRLWLLLAGVLICNAVTAQQKITLNEKNAPLKKIFRLINKQSDWIFLYEKSVLDKSVPVTISVVNADIREVLDVCMKNQPLTYIISGNNIGIKLKTRVQAASSEVLEAQQTTDEDISITGHVTDSTGAPMEFVTVVNLPRGGRPKTYAVTNPAGDFHIYGQKGDRLVFSTVGYNNVELRYNGQSALNIRMKIAPIEINAVVIDNVNLSKKRVPFTDTIDMTHRGHLNLGQLLQGTIPGLTLQNTSSSVQKIASIDMGGGIVGGSTIPTIDALRAHYQQNQSIYAARGWPTFDSWINSFKGQLRFNYSTSVSNNGLVPQLRGASGFNGNMSGMLIVIDGFPQEGFPADYPMANIESVKVIKDPEELTKWGPRATGGLIMITTKRGTANQLRLNYVSQFNYSPTPRYNRVKMQMASSADMIDYMRSASDSGFLKLGSKDYPLTGFNLNSAERVFQRWQQGSISQDEYNFQLDSLSSLDNEGQMRLLQQQAYGQNQTLSLSGGAGIWRFIAIGTYATNRSSALGNNSKSYRLVLNNDFSLLKNKMQAQWYLNLGHSNDQTGFNADFSRNLPFQLLVDPITGDYVYDYSNFPASANEAIKKYGFINYGSNKLEDARLNKIMTKSLETQSRLSVDWDILPSLKWSNSLQFDINNNKTDIIDDAASSKARQLYNDYGSPVFDDFGNVTRVDFYVPRGGILNKSTIRINNWNLRTALQFDEKFGKNRLSATISGFGAAYAQYKPSFAPIYGYDPQTGKGQPVRLPSNPQDGILNLYSLPQPFWQDTYGRMVYPYTLLSALNGDTLRNRSLNWNANLAYSFDSTYMLNGQYTSTLIQSYGQPSPYTSLDIYGGSAAWSLSRMSFMRMPVWINNITLSAGIDGISIPSLPNDIQAYRDVQPSWNNYSIRVQGFNFAQQRRQRSNNIYEKLTAGLLDNRISFDVAYNSMRINKINENETLINNIVKNYVSMGGRVKFREGLLQLMGSYGYSLDGNPQTNARFIYDIGKERYFNSRIVSKMIADFILQDISAFQGLGLMNSTNLPLAGGGFSPAIPGSLSILPPHVKNLEAHTTLGFINDRFMLDLRYYHKTIAGVNSNIRIPADPSTGLMSKNTYSKVVNKGVEFYLQAKAVQRTNFRYVITLNGAYNQNIVKEVPNTNFSTDRGYLFAPRNGYSVDNLWSFRWGGLNNTGSPMIYDNKGNKTSTLDTASVMAALVYSGVTRPPLTGGFIQEWDYKGFFARVVLVFNFGHVMREYIPVPSRGIDYSILIKDRWRKPGDEAFTNIPAMYDDGVDANFRGLVTQNSTFSIMPADHIRLQEVQIGWHGTPGKFLQNYFKDFLVSVQAMNLALWTRNKLHVDPESVLGYGTVALPLPKQFSLTVNMKF